jgi:hypothetical protein
MDGHHFSYITKSRKKIINCGCETKSNKNFHVNMIFKNETQVT